MSSVIVSCSPLYDIPTKYLFHWNKCTLLTEYVGPTKTHCASVPQRLFLLRGGTMHQGDRGVLHAGITGKYIYFF